MYPFFSFLRRLSVKNLIGAEKCRSIHFNAAPLCFNLTQILCAEPLKKKRRVDPAVLKERAEKKIKRLQRDIRKLERVSKKFKPISELEPPKKILRESDRLRPPLQLREEEIQERAELKHLWAIYKRKEHVAEMYAIQRIINAQEKAMDALQEASPELYEEALQPDPALIPYKLQGPVETPAIDNFDYPDGDFIDATKKYLPIVIADPKKNKKVGFSKKKN